MNFELSEIQEKGIVDHYGSTIAVVKEVAQLVNNLDLPIDEDVFVEIVASVASMMETDNFEKKLGKKKRERAGYTVEEATIEVLIRKFNDDSFYDRETNQKIMILKQKSKFNYNDVQ